MKRHLINSLLLALSIALVGPAVAKEAPAAARGVAAQPEVAGVVNINRATAEQLVLLPGVGPSKAQAIITFREKRPFKRKEQLLQVRGIGAKGLQALRPYVTLEGETTLKSKVRAAR